jgi:hypothetical protein
MMRNKISFAELLELALKAGREKNFDYCQNPTASNNLYFLKETVFPKNLKQCVNNLTKIDIYQYHLPLPSQKIDIKI